MRLGRCGQAIGFGVVVSAGCVGASAPSGTAPPPAPLTELVAPAHPDAAPWSFPGPTTPGEGPCASTTLGAVLDEIRRGFPAVADITSLKPAGPVGVTVAAGGAVAQGTSPPPPAEVTSYIIGLSDARAFGAMFFRGAGCRGDLCQDRSYWYFETGEGCRPRWVGHNRAVDRPGGAHGPCVEFAGASLWSTPGEPAPRARCDADWSPQDISGTRRAVAIDPFAGCGRQDPARVGPDQVTAIQLSIAQGADRRLAELSLIDTGIPFLDGRSFAGLVERQSFTSLTDETTAGDPCPVHRRIEIRVDFEEPTFIGLPGGFGTVDIVGEVPAGCSPVPAACRSSLHLVKEGVFPTSP